MTAANYEEWRAEAQARDEQTGAARWKADDRTDLFDYRVIRRRMDELVDVRAEGDPRRILYYLNEGLHGNMGGMGSSRLYGRAALGTKDLVSDYVRELAGALEQLAGADEEILSFERKLAFFRSARQAFGNCALMLSGAGSLGPFHLGVAKALLEQDLLPAVISGASAGGLVAATVCTRTDETLQEMFDQGAFALAFQEPAGEQAFRRRRVTHDDLRGAVETLIPDMTFGEALEESGRDLSISVAPAEVQQQSRTLNAVTSPNALIREAVMATCAIPGVFPPVTLAARGVDGQRLPFVRSRKWVDGSVTDDMPTGRLARVYGCNFFIASQANPVAMWSPQVPRGPDPISQLASIYLSSWKQWFRVAYPFAMRFVQDVYPLNVMTRMGFSVLTQEYTADVNIMPKRRLLDPAALLSTLSPEETDKLVREGEAATWPQVERIRNSTLIGRTIAGVLGRLASPVRLQAIRAAEA
ncbi:MAG: DUF3336 domain-containing protein [Gammaproteobacteria bacterium]|nr:DUF3336 domain-containing protein [Gammaproteobacteria bacterium]